MQAIEKFKRTLEARIDKVSAQLNELDKQKNIKLELENIFFKYELNGIKITPNDVMKLSESDFARIVALIYDNNDNDAALFSEYLKIIKLHQQLVSEGKVPLEVMQELEARNWFTIKAIRIANYFRGLLSDTEISNLKTSVAIYQKYRDAFQADELITPIFDLKEFNNLLVISGLSIAEMAAMKKQVGQGNYLLVTAEKSAPANDDYLLDKYKTVLAKKSKTYADDIKAILLYIKETNLNLNLTELEKQIIELANQKKDLAYKNIQNAVVCIMLANELKAYQNADASVNIKAKRDMLANTIRSCEKLLTISRKHAPKVSTQPKENKNAEAAKLIKAAAAIIDSEREFLISINPDDYTRYTQLLSLVDKESGNSAEANKYRLAMIVESLKQELKAFEITASKYAELPEAFSQNYKQQIGTIREYLEIYEVLKSRVQTLETNNNQNADEYNIIYLTNDEGNAVISQYVATLAVTYRKIIKSLLLSLSKGKISNKESAIEIDDYTVYNAERRNVTLSYILLNDKTILVLLAAQKKFDFYNELSQIIEKNNSKIEMLKTQIEKAEGLANLLLEQASLRSQLDKLFN